MKPGSNMQSNGGQTTAVVTALVNAHDDLVLRPSGAPVRPFCKWVGGQRQLLTLLREFCPTQFRRYFEPFVDGSAVFLDLLYRERLAGLRPSNQPPRS